MWAEVETRLNATERKNVGAFAAVQVVPPKQVTFPTSTRPGWSSCTQKRATRAEKASNLMPHDSRTPRQRNAAPPTVLTETCWCFSPRTDRLAEVDAAVRDYLGWKNVSERAHELGLTLQQIQQANERKERSSTTVDDRILGAYHWTLAPEWPQSAQSFTLTATKAEGAAASLAERVSKRMITDSTLNTERAASLIRLDIANHLSTLWEERGHISVEELWGYYTDYPYMPRLRDRDVLDTGIQGFSQGYMYWQQECFAVADSVADTGRYLGLVLPTDDRPVTVRNTTLLVRPDVAEQQRAQEKPPETAPADATPATEHTAAGAGIRVVPTPTQAMYKRFYGSRLLNPEEIRRGLLENHQRDPSATRWGRRHPARGSRRSHSCQSDGIR